MLLARLSWDVAVTKVSPCCRGRLTVLNDSSSRPKVYFVFSRCEAERTEAGTTFTINPCPPIILYTLHAHSYGSRGRAKVVDAASGDGATQFVKLRVLNPTFRNHLVSPF